MSTRSLAILAAITLVVLVAAFLTSSRTTREPASPTSTLLFPNLAINDVRSVEITDTKSSVTLAASGDEWVIESRGGYPSKFEPVKELILAMSEATIVDTKTDDPAQHARLQVGDPTEGASGGSRIVLRDAGGNELAGVVLGNREPGAQEHRFARRIGEDQVFLAEFGASPASETMKWVSPEVIRLTRDRVARVSIERPEGQLVEIERTSESNTAFTLLNLPASIRARSSFELSKIAGALGFVDLIDVRPASQLETIVPADEEDATLPDPFLATYTTTDGLEIGVTLWPIRDQRWMTLVAEAADPEATDETGETAEVRARRLNDNLRGWVFQVQPAVALPILTATLAELTEPVQPPAPAPSSDAPEAGDEG